MPCERAKFVGKPQTPTPFWSRFLFPLPSLLKPARVNHIRQPAGESQGTRVVGEIAVEGAGAGDTVDGGEAGETIHNQGAADETAAGQ